MVVVDESVEGVQDKLSPCHAAPASPLGLSGVSAADLPLLSNLTVLKHLTTAHFREKFFTTNFTVHAPSDAPLVVPGLLVQ
jgi:hypothetical protein